MASQKQQIANRANAARSTGPRSELGKSRSSLNGLKHGLVAKQVVFGDENPIEFDALRAGLQQEFAPGTRFTELMVDRLAEIVWRLRRVARLEAAILEANLTVSGGKSNVTFDEARHHDHLAEISKMFLPENRLPRGESSARAALIDSREPKKEAITDDGRAGEIQSSERKYDAETVIEKLGMAIVRDDQVTETLAKLTRHEAFLMNCLSKTLHLLELYRSRERVLNKTDFPPKRRGATSQ
jgi:hypothetical protein